MIGKKLSRILVELEETLWEFDINVASKPEYTEDGFRAACKIFMSVLLDKMWDLQESEKMDIETRSNMALKAGNDFKKFIKTYTDIDTETLYDETESL